MVDEIGSWRDSLRAVEQELKRFQRNVQGVERALRKARRAEGDAEASLGLLAALKNLPTTPSIDLDLGRWQEYWEEKRRRTQLEFKLHLEDALCGLEEKIRQETGENWKVRVEGSYPRYTIAGVLIIDVGRFGSDVTRAAGEIEKRLRAVVRRRFKSPDEFLLCLLGAYRTVVMLDELRAVQVRPQQDLRRLHRALPAVMRELELGGAGRDKYPLEAFGVDLARCLVAGVREVKGEHLELITTKFAADGVRVVHPELDGQIYGKVQFIKGG